MFIQFDIRVSRRNSKTHVWQDKMVHKCGILIILVVNYRAVQEILCLMYFIRWTQRLRIISPEVMSMTFKELLYIVTSVNGLSDELGHNAAQAVTLESKPESTECRNHYIGNRAHPKCFYLLFLCCSFVARLSLQPCGTELATFSNPSSQTCEEKNPRNLEEPNSFSN